MPHAGRVTPTPPDGSDVPAFRPRASWWGGDLQTCRNFLIRRFTGGVGVDLSSYASRRLVLPLSDGSGDRLSAVLNLPDNQPTMRPLAILTHGLSGSEGSSYMQRSAAHLLTQGFPVLRLNLRGAGLSRPLCSGEYHAGRSQDLRDVLAALDQDLMARCAVLIGYSLGASLVLRLLGEAPPAAVRAAVTVSAPIDLAEADRRLQSPRNRFYHDRLLVRVKRDALAPGAIVSGEERAAATRAATLRTFNAQFVAPRNGFDGVDDYYRRCQAVGTLPAIRVPTLLVHAANDPWIPADAYRRVNWSSNPWLLPLLAPGGGHVGFHARGDRVSWHDRALGRLHGETRGKMND